MSDEKKAKRAQEIFEAVCSYFDAKEYNYKRHDEDKVVTITTRGEDIPIDFIIKVREDHEVLSFISFMPFTVPEDKRTDTALVLNVINENLINGSFSIDLEDGKIRFRMSAGYMGSLIGQEVYDYMFMVSALTIDEYNDKLMMYAKDMISLEQLLKTVLS